MLLHSPANAGAAILVRQESRPAHVATGLPSCVPQLPAPLQHPGPSARHHSRTNRVQVASSSWAGPGGYSSPQSTPLGQVPPGGWALDGTPDWPTEGMPSYLQTHTQRDFYTFLLDNATPQHASRVIARHTREVWESIRRDVEGDAAEEPLLRAFLYDSVLGHASFESSLAFVLSGALASPTLLQSSLYQVFSGVMLNSQEVRLGALADLEAAVVRDPTCGCLAQGLLYTKGFHATQAQRIAHALWGRGQKVMAIALQSRISEVFAVDMHPAARIGRGVLLNHGTGAVIGETAIIGHNVTLLQNVTLGGTGKETGDRHPKIRDNVLVGASATILGNIVIGRGSAVAAGALVLKPVPPYTVVAGSPAKNAGQVPRPLQEELWSSRYYALLDDEEGLALLQRTFGSYDSEQDLGGDAYVPTSNFATAAPAAPLTTSSSGATASNIVPAAGVAGSAGSSNGASSSSKPQPSLYPQPSPPSPTPRAGQEREQVLGWPGPPRSVGNSPGSSGSGSMGGSSSGGGFGAGPATANGAGHSNGHANGTAAHYNNGSGSANGVRVQAPRKTSERAPTAWLPNGFPVPPPPSDNVGGAGARGSSGSGAGSYSNGQHSPSQSLSRQAAAPFNLPLRTGVYGSKQPLPQDFDFSASGDDVSASSQQTAASDSSARGEDGGARGAPNRPLSSPSQAAPASPTGSADGGAKSTKPQRPDSASTPAKRLADALQAHKKFGQSTGQEPEFYI